MPDFSAHPSSPLKDASSAWRPWAPGPDRPWTPPLAAHLLRRTGAGPNEAEWQAALRDGPAATVERLLKPGTAARTFNEQFDALEPGRPGSAETLAAWWLRRMLETPHPFTEWLTRFWHGSLAVRVDQLPDAGLLVARLRRLRQLALAPLPELVAAPLADPAVLLALGEGANRRARPNLALARAFLSDFAVGPEAATERDVHEAARALTGWFVRRGRLQFVEREFDPGEKTIFGQRGPWGRDDLVRLVLEQPAFHRRLVGRLYRALVTEVDPPDEGLVAPLATRLAADHDLRDVLRTILRSEHFYSETARARRMKSPVDLAVGLARAASALIPTAPLTHDLANLGQDLTRPPTRQGWAGGAHWITDRTLVLRANLLTKLLAADGRYKGRLRAAVDSPSLLQRLWPGTGPIPEERALSPDALLRQLLQPEFQLA